MKEKLSTNKNKMMISLKMKQNRFMLIISFSFLLSELISCSGESKLSVLRDLVEGIESENMDALDSEIESYFDVQHHLTKTRKSDENTFVLMELANLQVHISILSHSIKLRSMMKLKEVLDKKEMNEDDLNLIVARVVFRTKLTILDLIGSDWRKFFKLIKNHKESPIVIDYLESLVERLDRDSLMITDEKDYLKERLDKLNGDESISKLQAIDQLIDGLFECSSEKTTDVFNAAPLADYETMKKWIKEQMNEDLLDTIAKNEHHLMVKVKEVQLTDEDNLDLGRIQEELFEIVEPQVYSKDDYDYLVPT